MGRRKKCEGTMMYCDCRWHENARRRADAARYNDDSDSTHETLGFVADAALAGTSLFGMATSPPEPMNTDQAADSHQTQVERYRQSNEEASRKQGTPSSRRK